MICSLNPAVLLSSMKGQDILTLGSKNPGATNIYRLFGAKASFMVFIFDLAKPICAWLLIHTFFQPSNLTIFLFPLVAILGHCYSPLLNMKGGKGVATYFGVLILLNKIAFFTALIAWLATFALMRTSWKSSLTACLISVAFSPMTLALSLLPPVALIILRHRPNFSAQAS